MINETIKGFELSFKSFDEGFSPMQIDKGTLAMLSCVEFGADDKVLDLGCGYGVVGILAAKFASPENVFLIDNDEKAIECAARNAALNNVRGINILHSHAYENLNETGFNLILCNPPYHSDFSVPKKFIEKGFNRLMIGGRFFMVTKRKDWYKKKFISVFGGVKIHFLNDYYVFEAEKRSYTMGHS